MFLALFALPPPERPVVLGELHPVASCEGWVPAEQAPGAPFGAVFHLMACAENSSSDFRRIDLPEGTVLEVEGAGGAWQRLMVSPGLALRVDPHTAYTFSLRALCTEPGKFSPFNAYVVAKGFVPSAVLRAFRATRPSEAWRPEPAGLLAIAYAVDGHALPPPGEIDIP